MAGEIQVIHIQKPIRQVHIPGGRKRQARNVASSSRNENYSRWQAVAALQAAETRQADPELKSRHPGASNAQQAGRYGRQNPAGPERRRQAQAADLQKRQNPGRTVQAAVPAETAGRCR